MRTTLDIDDSILAAAQEIASARNSSVGAVISDLAGNGLSLTSGRSCRTKSGFPVFSVPAEAKPDAPATVKSILSDEELPVRR
jgi:hypothetical protein